MTSLASLKGVAFGKPRKGMLDPPTDRSGWSNEVRQNGQAAEAGPMLENDEFSEASAVWWHPCAQI